MPHLARVSYPTKVVAVGIRLLCGCSGIQVVSVRTLGMSNLNRFPLTNEQRFLVGSFSLYKLYLVKCWHRDLGSVRRLVGIK